MRMRKSTISGFLLSAFISIVILHSCKNDNYLLSPAPVPDQSFTEEFDTFQNAYNRGWRFVNHSEPIGTQDWVNGGVGPYSGVGNLFTSYLAGSGLATISTWAISPSVILQNGDKIIFYTLTVGAAFPDRLQVRINNVNDGVNVGTHADEVGDFTIPLLDINPYYSDAAPDAYPEAWTRFEATVFGLNNPQRGRFAFRYFVEDGGPSGANSNGIAIDSVAYVSKK